MTDAARPDPDKGKDKDKKKPKNQGKQKEAEAPRPLPLHPKSDKDTVRNLPHFKGDFTIGNSGVHGETVKRAVKAILKWGRQLLRGYSPDAVDDKLGRLVAAIAAEQGKNPDHLRTAAQMGQYVYRALMNARNDLEEEEQAQAERFDRSDEAIEAIRAHGVSPLDAIIADEFTDMVLLTIKEMEPDLRATANLTLRGYKVQDIADRRRTPRRTVAQWKTDALKILAAAIERYRGS